MYDMVALVMRCYAIALLVSSLRALDLHGSKIMDNASHNCVKVYVFSCMEGDTNT